MENYILYGEVNSSPARVLFKARLKQSVLYVGVHCYDAALLDYVTANVQSLHNLKHQNVVQFIDWYQSPQHIWVVTELLNGGTLAGIMDLDGPMAGETACEFISDIAAGLRYVHLQGIVLCDLIPSKVLVDCHGILKISDFSFSQRLDGQKRWSIDDVKRSFDVMFKAFADSRANNDKGEELEEVRGFYPVARNMSLATLPSPFYKAPEVIQKANFSFASDLWSLGCILYELITGKCPFPGEINKELSVAVVTLDEGSNSERVTDDERVQSIVSGLLQQKEEKRLNWESTELQNLIIA